MCFFQFFYTENISVYINDFLKIKMGGAVGQKKKSNPFDCHSCQFIVLLHVIFFAVSLKLDPHPSENSWNKESMPFLWVYFN